MSAELLYGTPCAEEILRETEKEMRGKSATLYTVGFGDPQWKQYTQALAKSAAQCGFATNNVYLDFDAEVEAMREKVRKACVAKDAAGVLVEQPLPARFADVVNDIDKSLDVDCLSPLSVAALYRGENGFRPATPSAVIRLLDFYRIPIRGKRAVIVGRGNAVGKPLALMMLSRDATVTVCHTKTVELAQICSTADILVSACGVPALIKSDFVADGATVIDVGLSFVNGKACGDVDTSVYGKCRAVTPVPKGVGPVTRAVLLENMLKAVKNK